MERKSKEWQAKQSKEWHAKNAEFLANDESRDKIWGEMQELKQQMKTLEGAESAPAKGAKEAPTTTAKEAPAPAAVSDGDRKALEELRNNPKFSKDGGVSANFGKHAELLKKVFGKTKVSREELEAALKQHEYDSLFEGM